MQHYDAIIFDMDGTLWDVAASCAAGWNLALDELGAPGKLVTPADIRKVAGLPFAECVKELIGDLELGDIGELTEEIDRHEQRVLEASGGRLYQGVRSGIKALAKDYPLFLVSNCQAWYLDLFWKHSELRPYFRDGACHGDRQQPKAEMIAEIIGTHSLNRPIYVGDTEADQKASHQANADFAHASYGFGEVGDPSLSFSSFPELVEWFARGELD